MTMRGLAVAVISVVTCVLVSGCAVFDPATGSRSCDPHGSMRHPLHNADWMNFIQWKGRLYAANSSVETQAKFGQQLGKVRCQFDGSRTPVGSRPRNRDAAFLRPGTPFFVVEGVSETVGIGATLDGRRLLYLAQPPRP